MLTKVIDIKAYRRTFGQHHTLLRWLLQALLQDLNAAAFVRYQRIVPLYFSGILAFSSTFRDEP